jgi:hypothetical protein
MACRRSPLGRLPWIARAIPPARVVNVEPATHTLTVHEMMRTRLKVDNDNPACWGDFRVFGRLRGHLALNNRRSLQRRLPNKAAQGQFEAASRTRDLRPLRRTQTDRNNLPHGVICPSRANSPRRKIFAQPCGSSPSLPNALGEVSRPSLKRNGPARAERGKLGTRRVRTGSRCVPPSPKAARPCWRFRPLGCKPFVPAPEPFTACGCGGERHPVPLVRGRLRPCVLRARRAASV